MASWYHRPLALGSQGPDVELVRRKLNAAHTGPFDSDLEARVRGVQRRNSLPVTGVIDKDTAEAIGEPARKGLVPEWYRRPLGPGCHGDDVEALSVMLGVEPTTAYTSDIEARVRRLQSQLKTTPTGVVDEALAISIGDDVPLFHEV